MPSLTGGAGGAANAGGGTAGGFFGSMDTSGWIVNVGGQQQAALTPTPQKVAYQPGAFGIPTTAAFSPARVGVAPFTAGASLSDPVVLMALAVLVLFAMKHAK